MPEDKKIDESWKDQVAQEKEKKDADMPQDEAIQPNFALFISSLGMQAMVFLGEIENPATKKVEKDLPQAKYIIDIIDLLKEKTKGNLTKEEQQLVDDLLYELKMKYIKATK